jgi:hypothetical protein
VTFEFGVPSNITGTVIRLTFGYNTRMIEVVHTAITRSRLKEISSGQFGDFVKAVIDVDRGLMAVGGDMHADEEATLIDNGSLQRNLWGINLYPDLPDDQWVEFDSKAIDLVMSRTPEFATRYLQS